MMNLIQMGNQRESMKKKYEDIGFIHTIVIMEKNW